MKEESEEDDENYRTLSHAISDNLLEDTETLVKTIIAERSDLLERGLEKEKVVVDEDDIDFSFLDEI